MAFPYPSLILVDTSLVTNLVNVGFNSGSVVSPHTIEYFSKDTAIVIFCSTVTFVVVIRNTTKFVPNSFSHSFTKSFQRLPRLKSALHVASYLPTVFSPALAPLVVIDGRTASACNIHGCINRFPLIISSIIVKIINGTRSPENLERHT